MALRQGCGVRIESQPRQMLTGDHQDLGPIKNICPLALWLHQMQQHFLFYKFFK